MTSGAETRQPSSFTQPKLLLVEGQDEIKFFDALLMRLELHDVQVRSYNGIPKLRPFLRTLPVTPGFAGLVSVGVVRDADDNAGGAFESVSAALFAAGLVAPTRPFGLAGDRPRVSVAILPPENQSGTLEDLCLEAVSADPAMQCVDSYLECLAANGLNPRPLAKARVHTFLASRNRPDRRLGEAAEAGEWPWDSPVFDIVKNFLSNL
jgi:hypothetical protein